jgi:hypothetical protein
MQKKVPPRSRARGGRTENLYEFDPRVDPLGEGGKTRSSKELIVKTSDFLDPYCPF